MMFTPQQIRDLTNFLEGELSGAKKILVWVSQEMAKDEKTKQEPEAVKENEEKSDGNE